MADEGVQILSYKGDADLGGFGPDGVPYPGSSGKELESLSNYNDHLTQQNFIWNQRKYAQAIKDRDDVMDMVASQKIDSPLLEGDQKVLDANFKGIEDLVLATPNIKGNMDKWLELQQKLRESGSKQTYAKTRYVEAAKQRLDISNTVDPQLKQKKQDHLDEQIKKGVDHVIDPYNNQLDWDPAVLFPDAKEKVKSSKTEVGKDGLFHTTTTTETDLEDMLKHFSFSSLAEGENKTFPDQVDKFYKFAIANPTIMNDSVLNKINSRLNEINISKGYKSGDGNFIAPIATKGADGNWAPANGVDFTKAWYVYHNYKTTSTTALDKQAQEMAKIKSETAENYAQAQSAKALAGKYGADAKLALANIKKAEADGDKTLAETEQLKYKTAVLKSTASQPVYEANKFFTEETKNEAKLKFLPLSSINIKTATATVNGVKLAESADIPSDYVAKEIPKSTTSAVEMLADPYWLNKESKQGFSGWNTPAKILLFTSPDKDPSKSKLVGYDANGNVLKKVDVTTGFENLIRYNKKYNGDKDMLDQINAGRLIIQEGGSASGTNTTTETTSEGSLRKTGESIEVYTKGQWKKAIGRTPTGDIITE